MNRSLEFSDRRMFITQLGRATFGVAVFGTLLAACNTEKSVSTSTSAPASATTVGPATTGASTTVEAASPADLPETSVAPEAEGAAPAVQRVNLGFVSAYVLSRGGEAAVVDTGVSGSEGAIEEGLATLGLGWGAVGHVILTHRHPDHIGSAPAVLNAAAAAAAYAGEADIPAIEAGGTITPVGDGDTVFGLDVIHTPGHTPGHICVLEPVGRVLLAGDAMIGVDGGIAGPDPQFATDLAMAIESVAKLARFDYETVLFGHGEPVVGSASAQVAELAAGL